MNDIPGQILINEARFPRNSAMIGFWSLSVVSSNPFSSKSSKRSNTFRPKTTTTNRFWSLIENSVFTTSKGLIHYSLPDCLYKSTSDLKIWFSVRLLKSLKKILFNSYGSLYFLSLKTSIVDIFKEKHRSFLNNQSWIYYPKPSYFKKWLQKEIFLMKENGKKLRLDLQNSSVNDHPGIHWP